MTDDVAVILPRREAQGLYDLLEVGLSPKPGKPSALLDSKGKPKPPILVALKSVFPSIYSALEDALKAESCRQILSGMLDGLEVASRPCILPFDHEGAHKSGDGETW